MYKTVFVVLALAVCSGMADPKPGVVAAAYTSPFIAPAVVTAQSSQVVARNYNGIVAPLVAASPYVAAPYVKAAPLVSAPLAYSPYYNPYVSPYVHAPSTVIV